MRLAGRSLFLICLPFTTVVCAAPVHVWEKVEITLQAANAYAAPCGSVQVWVDLEGPQFSKRCYGFWDGENTFRVRVMATGPGTWTWRSGSQPEDAGLSGKSGTFEAVPWTEADRQANPNRRGQVRIAVGGRYFEYADGTPFFLLADTLWAGNTERCGLGEKEDGPFFQYLADRQAKGFTAVLMQYIHGYGDYPDAQAHRNEGGYAFLERDPARLNPAYFQALDRRMQALWERGFVAAVPTMWWGKTKKSLFTPEDACRISTYCAARYGTYNAIWSLSGEYQYTFADCGWTPADFDMLGTEVQQHNPLRHPLSIHPSSSTNWKSPHNTQSSSPFHGAAWLDHHWLQTGQDVGRLFNIVTRLAENRALRPVVPVFCSEACYERASDSASAYHTRWQVWTVFLNGAAGYGYGAHGVWQFLDPSDPKGETGKMTNHPPVPWRDAIRLPGSAEVHPARTLLTSFDWWTLEPRRDGLRVDGKPNRLPTAADLTPPHAARLGSGAWIVYVPRGNEKREIALSAGPAGSNTARWFDPRRGEYAGPALAWSGATGTLPPRPAPAAEDWVLVVEGSTVPRTHSGVTTNGDDYFPPPETKGAWRALVPANMVATPEQKTAIRHRAGLDWGKQICAVVPSLDMVVVRLGPNRTLNEHPEFYLQLFSRMMAAVADRDPASSGESTLLSLSRLADDPRHGGIDKAEGFNHAAGQRTLVSPAYAQDIALRVLVVTP